jgi:hypothetical protein
MELGQPLAGCFAEWSKKQRRQAVKALTALSNDYQVLQGDVRPENFLLNRAGRVVVIDLESCVKELDEGIRELALRRAVAEIKGTSATSLRYTAVAFVSHPVPALPGRRVGGLPAV